MNYEHVSKEQLVRYITGRAVPQLPRLRDIARNPNLLLSVNGIGDATARRIEAALELGRRYVAEPLQGRLMITTPEDVVRHYAPRMRDLPTERFVVLLLDKGGYVIRERIISEGIVNASLVHPREVFHAAVTEHASSIILMHNHPSGVREASREDHTITRQLVNAGKLMDLPVNDHVIIAGDTYISFAENGWLE